MVVCTLYVYGKNWYEFDEINERMSKLKYRHTVINLRLILKACKETLAKPELFMEKGVNSQVCCIIEEEVTPLDVDKNAIKFGSQNCLRDILTPVH